MDDDDNDEGGGAGEGDDEFVRGEWISSETAFKYK